MIDGVAESSTNSTRLSPIGAVRPRTHVQLTGRSAEVTALEQEIERVARSDAKVLITGESGVGKEIVARAIHARGPRAGHVFAPVNCAGLPETLLESELFGHVKGSFTGAYRDKPGKLESAHMGTIFLDEIGEMTLRMQGLLLRFLETGELQKVGADGSGRIVNVRVIAATNRNLRDMITQGTFREDLFYRLNVIHIVVPPLRDRREDIPAAGRSTSSTQFAAANRSPIIGVSPGGDEGAGRVLVAGQRPRARERHRAPGRDGAAAPRSSSSDLPSEIRVAATSALRPQARAPAHGGRRSLQADDRAARVVLDGGVSAVHGPRDHARERARGRAARSRRSARQLQDRRAAVQHGSRATTSAS